MKLNRVATIDIETTNLLSDMVDFKSFPYKLKNTEKLWCVVIMNVATKEAVRLIKEEITKERLKKELEDYDVIVAHNGIKFDFISLKLFEVLDYKIGWVGDKDSLFGKEVMFIDTLVVSRLLNPVLGGGHSLDMWGKRLGHEKVDFRQLCIDKGYIQKSDPKGEEFKKFVPEMVDYCENDCLVNALLYEELRQELNSYKEWFLPLRMEQKLADLGIKRELFGFGFDKDSAIKAYEELTSLMEEKTNIVNPLLPPKAVNQTELNFYTPPKTQLLKNGSPSSAIKRFAIKHGAIIEKFDDDYYFKYKGDNKKLPFEEPLQTTVEADISNLDHVKEYLLSLEWEPTEWRERDLTKDSKKISLPLEKRVKALDRWFKETLEGKYTKHRLEVLEGKTIEEKYSNLRAGLQGDFPVRVRTSPSVRVGIEKELCSNLIKLGDSVSFAKDFALYLTYKSRRSNIGGGDIDEGEFEKGYLASYREEDQRIPTPSIEIGAISTRYKHISVANIPRVTSVYGKEVRSLFGAGEGFIQYGYDFSGLEARVMGHYVFPFKNGEELAKTMMAEKPNDIHCYSQDTEILTDNGWKYFNELNGKDKVAQFREGNIEFVIPDEIIWEKYEGEMIYDKNNDFLITPNHRVYYETYSAKRRNKNAQRVCRADEFLPSSDKRFLISGKIIQKDDDSITDDELRLLVAIQADGHLNKDSSAITFSFIKNRKIKRLLNLLKTLNLDFTEKEYNRKDKKEITIRIKAGEKTMELRGWLNKDKSFSNKFFKLSAKQMQVVIEEIQYWDGTITSRGAIVLDTTCRQTVEVLRTLCTLTNRKCSVNSYKKETCIIHRAYISHTNTKPYKKANLRFEKQTNYKGYIGCVAVPSGLVVVKRNGNVIISGNSVNGKKLGIPRTESKSINYMLIYGGTVNKVVSMLKVSKAKGKEIFNGFWEAMLPLKQFKEYLERQWEENERKFIIGIDGRKIQTRSKHSILNNAFQSCGVICAKYSHVFLFEDLEKQGYCIDPFEGKPDVSSMIEYHDEGQIAFNPEMADFKVFNTQEEAEYFVSNYKGEQQLSVINEGKEGKFYVTLPNPVSIATQDAINKTTELLNLNVELGYEWVVGKNWAQCH